MVYAFPFTECHNIYVGQTGRKLKERIVEHERAIRRGDLSNACAKHTRDTQHKMNTEDVVVVHQENKLGMRLNLESYTIAANKNRILNLAPPNTSMVNWAKILCNLYNTI